MFQQQAIPMGLPVIPFPLPVSIPDVGPFTVEPELALGQSLSTKPVFLGEIDDKSYYLDVNPKSGTYNEVIWKVPDIRDSIAASAGKCIVASDYSQIEIKIMAWLSKDPWLLAAINSKKDMHCWMAHDIFGAELNFTYENIAAAIKDKSHPRYDELTTLRNRTKRCSFGIPYGVSPSGLAILINSDEITAAALMDRYFAKAKVLNTWLVNQAKRAVSEGFTASLYGRKRFYEIPHPDDPKARDLLSQIGRWAGNHPIQSTSADMLKLAMIYLYKALRDGVVARAAKWGAQILFVVHDEMVTECDLEFANEMKLLVEEAMNWAYEQLIGSANVYQEAKAVVADVWSKA